MGLELLPGLIAAAAPGLHPLILTALVCTAIALLLWRVVRNFRREDGEALSKQWDVLDGRTQRYIAQLERDLEASRKRCDQCDAELQEVERRMRAEQWRADEALTRMREQRNALRHDRNNLRFTVIQLCTRLGIEPPAWPAEPPESTP